MYQSFQRFDNLLFCLTYGTSLDKERKKPLTAEYVWNLLKDKQEVLEWAIQTEKYKGRDVFCGTTICDYILRDYENTNQEIYTKLAKQVLSNVDLIHRGPGGVSFLYLVVSNKDFPLTEKEKETVLSEAMKMYRTTMWKQTELEFEKRLEEKGFDDNKTVVAEFGGQSQPVGAKSFWQYMYAVYGASHLNHGYTPYDIRYRILKNNNWSKEEKAKFINDFWAEQDEYDDVLEQLEWGIVNDDANFFEIDKEGNHLIEIDNIYDLTKDDILNLFASQGKSQKEAESLIEEIELCRYMHEVRPMQWERADENEIKIQI